MARIGYYLILKPLSYLPLTVLYLIADGLYLLMLSPLAYRHKVVLENIARAFPEKSKKEKCQLSRRFYRYFCDLIVENIRLFSISKEEAIRRFRIANPELLEEFYQKKQSIILAGGHYTNWELYAVAAAAQVPHTLLGIYSPLSNSFFNKKMIESRSKYGLKLIHKKKVRESMDRFGLDLTATCFAIDQCPRKDQKYQWTQFLSQETATHFGTEQYARSYNYAVVFGKGRRIRRGYYELQLQLVERFPKESPVGSITKKNTALLEQQIREAPEYWLWTHRRWKLKKVAQI